MTDPVAHHSSGHATSSQQPRRRFVTTRWSVVLRARSGTAASGGAGQALEQLCQTYWYPVYAFIRQQSRDTHEAQDRTQGFFAYLLSRSFLKKVSPERGRFRSWLLASVRNFLCNEYDRQATRRRGGQVRLVSLDLQSGEERYQYHASHQITAEQLFEREWALTLIGQVVTRLKDEMAASGQAAVFEVLSPCLTADRTAFNYADIGRLLGVSPDAARTAAHRLRKRYRQVLRSEIADTVGSAEEADDEVRRLFAALAPPGR